MEEYIDNTEVLTLACYVTKRMCFQQMNDGQENCEQEKKFYDGKMHGFWNGTLTCKLARIVPKIIGGLKRYPNNAMLCQDSAGALGNLSLYGA